MPFSPSDAETKHNELASTGAFVAYSGTKTGYLFDQRFSRSPTAKRIVRDDTR